MASLSRAVSVWSLNVYAVVFGRAGAREFLLDVCTRLCSDVTLYWCVCVCVYACQGVLSQWRRTADGGFMLAAGASHPIFMLT